MKKVFEEYFILALYAITAFIVITIFLAIVEGPELNYGLHNEEREEMSVHGEFDEIDADDVYFNILGRPLPYGINFDWTDYVTFDDGIAYKNNDGSENLDSEHCFAIVNGQKIDLTRYVTPANYTNATEIEISSHTYVHNKPKEYEAKVEIVPYVLNWENIHIKKNVAFFVLPNNMLMTFCGRAFMPDGTTAFKHKRIVYKKGDTEMAVSETDENGYFVIGIKDETLPKDLNNENIMPLGDYHLIVSAEGKSFKLSYPENTFNDDQQIYQLGNISFEE